MLHILDLVIKYLWRVIVIFILLFIVFIMFSTILNLV